MNAYESKKAARVERLRARAEKKREFAKENDLSLYGEEKSGIPLGQPILVGHHSEKRHRKHLQRIENKVRKGFEAAEYAEELERRADAAETSKNIDSDNPEAIRLIDEKIAKLTQRVEYVKAQNKRLSKFKTIVNFLKDCHDVRDIADVTPRLKWYAQPPDRISAYYLSTTNANAEIRRLKKRREQLAIVQDASRFETEVLEVEHAGLIHTIEVELKDGQVQVFFSFKPNEETRCALKRSPLALKWSSYSKRWVRKHTATTAVKWWREELIKTLKGARP